MHLSGESEAIISSTGDEVNFGDFVKMIITSLQSKGCVLAGQSYSVATEVAKVYYGVAICSMQFTKMRRFTSIISVEDWKILGLTFLSNSSATRKGVLEAFSSIMHIHPVHVKFLAFPCLLATDVELADKAEKALTFALRRLRRTHEDLAAVSAISDSSKTPNSNITNYTTKNLPEQILSYLLYLISYHPQLPDMLKIDTHDHCQVFKDIVKCVKFLINCLQQTLQIDGSNLPYMYKLANMIYRDYVDANDHENVRLRYLAGITLQILNSLVKSSENLQVYPGEIQLPKSLYEYIPQSSLQSIDEEIERSAEIIIGNVGRNKVKSSVGSSPFRHVKSRPIVDERVDESTARVSTSSRNNKFVNDEVPLRSLPKRSAKGGTKSYQVPDENDSEVDAWNDLIGHNRKISGGNDYSFQESDKKRKKVNIKALFNYSFKIL